MSTNNYKIAIATSDGKLINQGFGNAKSFNIYEVDSENNYKLLEVRDVENEDSEGSLSCNTTSESCSGCGNGGGGGCGSLPTKRAELLFDCRCLLVSEIGAKMQNVFSRRGISCFVYKGNIEEALIRIVAYYKRVDSHQSLVGFNKYK